MAAMKTKTNGSAVTTPLATTLEIGKGVEALEQSIVDALKSQSKPTARVRYEDTPIEDMARIHEELQRAADWFNVGQKLNLQKRFLVQVGEYKSSSLNYSTLLLGQKQDGVWIAPFKNADGEGVTVILMNPKHFDRPAQFILLDLFSRMAELKFWEQGIKVKSGERFNENWRDGVPAYGLQCVGQDARYGWKHTDYSPELAKAVNDKFKPKAEVFLLMATTLAQNPKSTKVQSQVKFQCKTCSATARALPTVKLHCSGRAEDLEKSTPAEPHAIIAMHRDE